jgi:uncharacterized protein YabE (DUF348 family)
MNISVKILKLFVFTVFFVCFSKVAIAKNIIGGKFVTLADEGLIFENIFSQADTVDSFLGEQKISLGGNDFIFPPKDSKIFSGSKIIIWRAKNVTIITDGKNVKSNVYGRTVTQALWENKISLGEDDFTKPVLNHPLRNGDKIEVIRVDIKEEIVKKDIPFNTTANEDSKLSWRIKKVTQKGAKGMKEITYKVVSYNNKEISRKVLDEEISKEPVTEIVTQGTYVKVGKASTGLGTWYSFTGTLAAASPWLPIGSYARVTNKENGKSVIVRINDRGPFGKGRIIDLDKVAFQKIASLGAGVIDVKVEPILN